MCHALRCPTPDATMRKEPGPNQACLVQPGIYQSNEGMVMETAAQSGRRNDHCSERLHPPELLHHLAWEDKPSLAQPGGEEQDPALECGKMPLVALAICPDLGAGHQHNTKQDTLITLPFHALLFPIHIITCEAISGQALSC